MKKLLIPLIAAFAANTVSAAAPQQVIDISTDKVSMVLTAAPGGDKGHPAPAPRGTWLP